MIGAGSVVTKNVNPYALMIGNPAAQDGWVSRSGYRLNFDEYNIAVCTHSGEKYNLHDSIVNLL